VAHAKHDTHDDAHPWVEIDGDEMTRVMWGDDQRKRFALFPTSN
jgi:hypothetical protein